MTLVWNARVFFVPSLACTLCALAFGCAKPDSRPLTLGAAGGTGATAGGAAAAGLGGSPGATAGNPSLAGVTTTAGQAPSNMGGGVAGAGGSALAGAGGLGWAGTGGAGLAGTSAQAGMGPVAGSGAGFGGTGAAGTGGAAGGAPKPNIIVVLTDDQGYAGVGFNGSPDIVTPHIDRTSGRGCTATTYGVRRRATPACRPGDVIIEDA